MRKSRRIVFSSSWSRARQAMEIEDEQYWAAGSILGPYKENCGQLR